MWEIIWDKKKLNDSTRSDWKTWFTVLIEYYIRFSWRQIECFMLLQWKKRSPKLNHTFTTLISILDTNEHFFVGFRNQLVFFLAILINLLKCKVCVLAAERGCVSVLVTPLCSCMSQVGQGVPQRREQRSGCLGGVPFLCSVCCHVSTHLSFSHKHTHTDFLKIQVWLVICCRRAWKLLVHLKYVLAFFKCICKMNVFLGRS